MDCVKRERVGGKGCKFESSGKCQEPSQPYYYCIEYMKHKPWMLSFSSLKIWEQCPRKYYYTDILGIKRKEIYSSLPLRLGSYFHGLHSQSQIPVYFAEDEIRGKFNIDILYKVMLELELYPPSIFHEMEVENRDIGFKGIVDLYSMDYFGELKLSAKPENYLNNWLAYDQLAYYFLLRRSVSYAYMLPVRTPALKEGKDEDNEMYKNRLYKDILSRPKFYFPEYGVNRSQCKWGRKYYAHEFDMELLKRKIAWHRDEIRYALNHGYFVQKFGNCTMYGNLCDYSPICESGEINEEVFEHKQSVNSTINKEGDIL